MNKAGKVLLVIVSAAVVLLIAAWLFVGALWSGVFNFLFPKEIATYRSPDGAYSLVFEEMGDPAWPFGPADVRLTLEHRSGKRIGRISTQVFNDGGSAGEWNIRSVSWGDEAVSVVLRGAEMEDKEITLEYKSN